ncbi:hypothetical protein C2W62_33025 [Candidatus Entotheonella serta]|nr:hypothetical protein C2W62_33025 [Candidatus Entotheonella serta]
MIETVILDDIRTDGGTQPREYLNELVLSEYAESMTGGTVFPPLILFFDGSHYWLADGFHRFFAAKKCGTQDITADVRQGTRRDARLYAVGANATHGLRRTNADKRRAALTLLQDEEWQRWSNREIARQCGVTHTFVAKLRRELLEESPSSAAAPSARTETASATTPPRPLAVDPPDTAVTGLGDTFFDASTSRQREDLFDQLTPSEPASTMDRLAFEDRQSPSDALDWEPLAEPHTHASTPTSTDLPTPDSREPDRNATSPRNAELMPDAKLSIEAMASTSQQAPAEWVTEMMVYWLLDLGAQYEGVTPELVSQAAGKLGVQYAQACRESAPLA